MGYKNGLAAFLRNYAHICILGGALVISLIAIMIVRSFDIAQLKLFGPTAQFYFVGIKNGLTAGTILLSIAFVAFLFFGSYVQKVSVALKQFFDALSNTQRNIAILFVCFLFTFVSHGGNVIYGYFNMDDLTIVGLNHLLPFSQAVMTPYGNDHAFPLFITEMKILDIFFGQNPIPYNFFFFSLFALIPFFTYLTLNRLGFGILSFATFLIIFGGAVGWTEIITGFYIMSIYPQIILFFSIASWAYVAWTQSKAIKYMAIFAIALTLAVSSDTSGIWSLPVILLFMIGVHYFKENSPAFQKLP